MSLVAHIHRVRPHATLDLSGMPCPAPLLGAKRVLNDLNSGDVLALISDCPGTRDDLFAWVKHTDHEILHTRKLGLKKIEYHIRKGKRPCYHANVVLEMLGVVCPGPVIEMKRIAGTLKSGDIIKLVTDCSAAIDEIATWCASTGNDLLQVGESDAGVWEFFIRRR